MVFLPKVQGHYPLSYRDTDVDREKNFKSICFFLNLPNDFFFGFRSSSDVVHRATGIPGHLLPGVRDTACGTRTANDAAAGG